MTQAIDFLYTFYRLYPLICVLIVVVLSFGCACFEYRLRMFIQARLTIGNGFLVAIIVLFADSNIRPIESFIAGLVLVVTLVWILWKFER
jgi:hypothetical protein